MVKKKNFLKNLSGDGLSKALQEYSPNIINVHPLTEKDLFDRYENYTDPLLAYVRIMNTDNVFVLGNEARAMFGHIADYRLDPSERKNLLDAYGHFRRLNLDAFKIICDELDEFLFSYFQKHYHYDYRNVRSNFLLQYSEKYFAAQKAYLNAQLKEQTGSDRLVGNIINEYFLAAGLYVDLFLFLQNNNVGLEKTKWKSIIRNAFVIISSVLGIVLSILA